MIVYSDSAASLLLRIVAICDEHCGAETDVPLSAQSKIKGDAGPTLALCSACGAKIQSFKEEIEAFKASVSSGDPIEQSGSQALWDEVLELRAKESVFGATKERIRRLEEREAIVEQREKLVAQACEGES